MTTKPEQPDTITLPMRAAGICAAEIIGILDVTVASGMPLVPLSVKKSADRVLAAAINRDLPAERRALLITAATALLLAAAIDESVATDEPEKNS